MRTIVVLALVLSFGVTASPAAAARVAVLLSSKVNEYEEALKGFEEVLKGVNPYGHTDIKDSMAYVRMLRRCSRKLSDQAFLKEIRVWQRSVSHG